MIGDPIMVSSTASDGEGRIDLHHPMRCGTVATTPRTENPQTVEATTTIPTWQETLCSDADLPLERRHACREATQWRSELADGQVTVIVMAGLCEPLRHEPPNEERIRRSDFHPPPSTKLGRGHHSQVGQAIPPTGGNSCHRHRTAGRVHPLASLRFCS
jgi:hypothetical protein